MPKQKNYTIPVTLRLTPNMMEYVGRQASERGLAVTDWIRFSICFAFWEEDFVKNYEGHHTPGWRVGDKPVVPEQHDFDYLGQFEFVCEEQKNPNSQTNLARQARIARLRAEKDRS